MKVTVVTSTMDGRAFVSVAKGTLNDETKIKITKFLMTDPEGDVQFAEVDVCDLKADLLDGGLQRVPVGSNGFINQENMQNGVIEQ